MFPSATEGRLVGTGLWIRVDRLGAIGLCFFMHWGIPCLLLPLLAGTAFSADPEPDGQPAAVAPAKVDPSQDLPKAVAAEPGFRESVEAAMTLPPKESIDAVTRLLERGVEGDGARDAAWFFEKYHMEHFRGRPRLKSAHWITVLNELARTRPVEAARLLEEKERLGESLEGQALMEVWGGSRPMDAIAWAKQGGEERLEWLNRNGWCLMTAWAAHDLDGLLAWLVDGNEPPGSAVPAMKAFKDQRGIAAVREWLETFGGEESTLSVVVRTAAAELVASEILSREGKQAAMNWVESREDPAERWQALHQVVPLMAAKEPREVVEWLERLSPQGGLPMWLAETSMNEWAARDLKAAGEWLDRHRGSPAANSYIWGYAVQLAVEDPAAALEWSKEVEGGIAAGFISSWNMPSSSGGEHFTAGYLEKIIAVTSAAAKHLENPDHPGVGLERPLELKYFPRLIREGSGAELQLRMYREPPYASFLMHDGKWTGSFPVYERQADGSLRFVTPAER